MATVLEIRDLYKSFSIPGSGRKVQAVNGVSFTLDKGETLALVGESGSGKTTVGRCVLGLEEPTRGRVLFEGEDLVAKEQRAPAPSARPDPAGLPGTGGIA